MQLSNIPGKLVLPWATSGNKNNIPVASQIGITAGAASLTDGFPPLTMTPVAAGGVPPSGLDMNGILYEMSTILRWANAGGGYAYDSTFANDSHVGGYPKGARVMRSDGFGYWLNTVDNNVTDPETSGAAAAGWVPDYQTGVAAVTMTSANVTLTPVQYGKPIIAITGALTSDLNLIFPPIAGEWVIINGTTGVHSITAKTAAGTGVALGSVTSVIGDGSNIYQSVPEATQVIATVAALRNLPVTPTRCIQTQGYWASGDGADAKYVPKTGASAGTYVDNGGTIIVPTGGDGSACWMLDAQIVTVEHFGALTTRTAAQNTPCIQANVNWLTIGGTLFFPKPGVYQINDEIRLDRPIIVKGVADGSFVNDSFGTIVQQTNTAKNAFTLVPRLANYAFAQYGILNIHFRDIAIIGPSSASHAPRGIGVDTTVNGGDFHIRECTFTNTNIRYFSTGIELVGIAYLNDFYGGSIALCDTGVSFYRGSASDTGGQTRFFGTTIDLITDACIRFFDDTVSGDLSLFGCTLADAQYGLITNRQATLNIQGCSFEALRKSGSLGAGIYIEITGSNPNTDAAKTIVGNKFYNNDASIWINKTTTAYSDGGFTWPMLIDSNTLLDNVALQITVPAGHVGIDSQSFVFGASNTGLSGGAVSSTQISSNFYGNDCRKRMVTRRYVFGASGQNFDLLPVGMVVTSARVYLTANATSFTALFAGDSDNNQRYFFFDGTSQTLNTWVNWTAPVPQFVIDTQLKKKLVISGTAGLNGATGVFEISGYLP